MNIRRLKKMYKNYTLYACDNAEYIYIHDGKICIAVFKLNPETTTYDFFPYGVGQKTDITIDPWIEEGYDVVKI